jgi:hypothetical protein
MNSTHYIDIHYNPDLQLVKCHWLRAISSSEYRLGMQQTCQVIESHHPVRWIIDATRLIAPNMADQKWTTELIGHCMNQVQLRKIALVLADDLFSEVVAEKISSRIMQMIRNPIKIASFNDFEKGMHWLLSDPETEGLFRDSVTHSNNDASKSW